MSKRTPSQQSYTSSQVGTEQNRTEDDIFHIAPDNSPHPPPTKRGFAPPQNSYTKIAPTLGFVLVWKLLPSHPTNCARDTDITLRHG